MYFDESLGTVSSSLYDGLLPSNDLPYWPIITFLGSIAVFGSIGVVAQCISVRTGFVEGDLTEIRVL